jgi:hypothetical protein
VIPGTCGAADKLPKKPGIQKLTPPSSAIAGLTTAPGTAKARMKRSRHPQDVLANPGRVPSINCFPPKEATIGHHMLAEISFNILCVTNSAACGAPNTPLNSTQTPQMLRRPGMRPPFVRLRLGVHDGVGERVTHEAVDGRGALRAVAAPFGVLHLRRDDVDAIPVALGEVDDRDADVIRR